MKWTLQEKNISDLILNEHNPRRITRDQAKALGDSLDRFGLIDKPVINADNRVIGGHQRIALLKKNRNKTVECWVPDSLLSDEQLNELTLRLNKNTGEWDDDVLFNCFDVDLLRDVGFSEKDLHSFEMIDEQQPPADASVDKCPECGQRIKKCKS